MKNKLLTKKIMQHIATKEQRRLFTLLTAAGILWISLVGGGIAALYLTTGSLYDNGILDLLQTLKNDREIIQFTITDILILIKDTVNPVWGVILIGAPIGLVLWRRKISTRKLLRQIRDITKYKNLLTR